MKISEVTRRDIIDSLTSEGVEWSGRLRAHGKAELSDIQRQRTDFGPLLDWLDARARAGLGISREKAQALREVPEEARMAAAESLCSKDEKLARAFAKWKSRFDHEWLRDAVRLFAVGDARAALDLLDSKGSLRIAASPEEARARLVGEWLSDKTPLVQKAMPSQTLGKKSQSSERFSRPARSQKTSCRQRQRTMELSLRHSKRLRASRLGSWRRRPRAACPCLIRQSSRGKWSRQSNPTRGRSH